VQEFITKKEKQKVWEYKDKNRKDKHEIKEV
jgi:hypothetical protein